MKQGRGGGKVYGFVMVVMTVDLCGYKQLFTPSPKPITRRLNSVNVHLDVLVAALHPLGRIDGLMPAGHHLQSAPEVNKPLICESSSSKLSS